MSSQCVQGDHCSFRVHKLKGNVWRVMNLRKEVEKKRVEPVSLYSDLISARLKIGRILENTETRIITGCSLSQTVFLCERLKVDQKTPAWLSVLEEKKLEINNNRISGVNISAFSWLFCRDFNMQVFRQGDNWCPWKPLSYCICLVYSEKHSMEERLRSKTSDADSFHLWPKLEYSTH